MSNSSEVRVSIVEESTPGTTPTNPAFLVLPTTGQDLQPLVRYIESQTLAPGRNRADLIRVSRSSGGSIPMEMRWALPAEAMFHVVRAALCASAETAAATASGALCITGSGVILLAAGFPQADWKIGDVVRIDGASVYPADGGYARIVGYSVATAGDAIEVDRVFAGDTVDVVRGARMDNAATHRHYTVEVARTDINKAAIFRLQVIDTLDIELATGAITRASLTLTGGDVEFVNAPISGTGMSAIYITGATYTSPPSRFVMDAVEVPIMKIAGVEYECNSVRMSLSNNALAREKIGLDSVKTVRRGQFLVQGSFQWYYDGSTEQAKYVNNQASDCYVVQEDSDGNAWTYSIPRMKYSSVRAPTSGPNSDDYFQGDYSAIVDSTNTYTLRVQRFAAP